MKTPTVIAALIAGVVLAGPAGSATDSEQARKVLERPPHYRLEDASPSIDALVARFLQALREKDAQALRRMCVTKAEYREYVVPGSVRKGAPPQALSETESEFFWDLLEAKSYHATVALLSRFGGRTYRLKGVVFEEGTSEYDWYVAHRDPAVQVETEDGRPLSIPVGAIAEIDGQFKFIAMHKDD